MKDEQRQQIIDIWKSIVEVQRHFNEISMKIRGVFITLLLALFASIGFLLDKKIGLNYCGVRIQFATIIPIFGILGSYLFYFIDRYWYHRLLVGSVEHAIKIEKKYVNDIPELSLSKAIGDASPYKPNYAVKMLAKIVVRHKKFRDTGQLHSDGKIEFFYKSVMLALALATVLLAIGGGITLDENTEPPQTVSSGLGG